MNLFPYLWSLLPQGHLVFMLFVQQHGPLALFCQNAKPQQILFSRYYIVSVPISEPRVIIIAFAAIYIDQTFTYYQPT
jgi:hypothetical protein